MKNQTGSPSGSLSASLQGDGRLLASPPIAVRIVSISAVVKAVSRTAKPATPSAS